MADYLKLLADDQRRHERLQLALRKAHFNNTCLSATMPISEIEKSDIDKFLDEYLGDEK